MLFLAPLIGGAVGAALVSIVGSLVGRVLVALAIGSVTYVGIDASLTYFKNSAVSAFSALPSTIVSVLALMQVGTCISMVFSAMVMRTVYSGMVNGAVTQWVKR